MDRVNRLLLLMALVMASVDCLDTDSNDDLGPPISPAEFAAALGNPLLRVPTHPNNTAIEDSGKFEGDIVLTKEQLTEMPEGRSATRSRIWANGVIPYTIARDFTSGERQYITKAMLEFATRTCLKFVPRTNERDHIHIMSGNGCHSHVGRTGGMQHVSLSRWGRCVDFGTIIHEFMHAAGFNHEQSRYDRDYYVDILWDNILRHQVHNFKMKTHVTSQDLGLPYDFKSVMHYPPDAFTANQRPTIVAKGGQQFGFRDGFSPLDVKGLNLLYKCKGTSTGTGTVTDTGSGSDTCTDISTRCAQYLYKCKTNSYVAGRCQKSCNLCQEQSSKKIKPEQNTCTDISPYCSQNLFQCKTLAYVAKMCKKSCNLCEDGVKPLEPKVPIKPTNPVVPTKPRTQCKKRKMCSKKGGVCQSKKSVCNGKVMKNWCSNSAVCDSVCCMPGTVKRKKM